jgi:GNAT superfamily N-acetyltransferase
VWRKRATTSPPDVELACTFEYVSRPIHWEDRAGIRRWSVGLLLRMHNRSPVLVARAGLWSVDLIEQFDLIYELDSISWDLGQVADGLLRRKALLLDEHGIGEGQDARLLIANIVAVDEAWRGASLGPALVHHAADVLEGDAVVLVSANLAVERTALDSFSVTPVSGRAGAKKVREAWGRAGFERLINRTLIAPSEALNPVWARSVVAGAPDRLHAGRLDAWLARIGAQPRVH